MAKQSPNWKRMQFKTNKVWIALTPDGNFLEKNGKFLMKYQINQDYEYWVNKSAVKPIDDREIKADGKTDPAPRRKSRKQHPLPPPTDSKYDGQTDQKDKIIIYTDGASSGNPGPSGIGIVLCFNDHEKEISKYIGSATNNIAELEAIRTALITLKKKNLPIRIYTDSNYALGVLAKGWKARKNQELIKSIKTIMSTFRDIKLVKVKGHANIQGNERADRLATDAIPRQGV